MMRTVAFAALVAFVLVGGCGDSEERAESPERARGDSGRRDDAAREIDRLRSLPYAGYAIGDSSDEEDGVVTHDQQRSWPGYNLHVMHGRSEAELIDASGRVLHTWSHKASQSWGNGEILPNGDFVVVGMDPTPFRAGLEADDRRYIMRFSWDGELLWKRRMTAHHDVELTPDGDLLTLTFARRSLPAVDPELPVRDDRLTLLSRDGKELEIISLYDVISTRPERFPLARVSPNSRGGTPWVDLFHCNSVEWMRDDRLAQRHPIYDRGNVLICLRHQNRVAIIDWDRREVVWAWGAKELSCPHDAHTLPNGNILVFDNGLTREWSRVVEVDPLARKIVWEYRAPNPEDFFTISKGANQRFPNGNTLITNSDNGVVFEVTRDGEVVWEYRCPHKNEEGKRATIVRMKRYEPAFIERLMNSAAPAARPDAP